MDDEGSCVSQVNLDGSKQEVEGTISNFLSHLSAVELHPQKERKTTCATLPFLYEK